MGTQEAWVVISGSINAVVYDTDEKLLARVFLGAGDCIVFFRGGHAMEVVKDTLMYEFKNGPYFGQEADKRWIG